jgi:hypothetical protein
MLALKDILQSLNIVSKQRLNTIFSRKLDFRVKREHDLSLRKEIQKMSGARGACVRGAVFGTVRRTVETPLRRHGEFACLDRDIFLNTVSARITRFRGCSSMNRW